ncbi:Fic family protein [Parabacteroides sp. FAFU027]|uniref:Fic family protein n=1 Tax=Parabacteroides sp. FAFU027 TaxID=2922715 RepID=UPI001FAFEE0E|nr:Fic family protein [Parabacteroides sp. FAFU027]
MNITTKKYFTTFTDRIGNQIPGWIAAYDFSEKRGGFDFLTKASAVYSSNIEGNSIDLNSFMNYELSKEKFKVGKEIAEIENLITTYEFAQHNPLTEANLLHCHKVLSETLLIKSKRGKYRTEQVGVFNKTGLAYLAVEPEFVKQEMATLFEQITELLSHNLSEEEVFYYAALIHMRFVHIHPFRDGNGRAARLLEKWFIAEKLGMQYWKLPSEEHYKINQQQYYNTLNLGVNYYELNYDRCVDFLCMLPECLK